MKFFERVLGLKCDLEKFGIKNIILENFQFENVILRKSWGFEGDLKILIIFLIFISWVLNFNRNWAWLLSVHLFYVSMGVD